MVVSHRIPQLLARVALLVTLAGLVAEGATAGEIGIDDRHGFDADARLGTGSDFETFRATIASGGHNLIPLDSFEAGDLAGLDCLILNQPYTQNTSSYSGSEIAAIHAFVAGGGGLMVHGEGGAGSDPLVADLNALVAPYGIEYAGGATDGVGHDITGFAVHPLTTGLNQIGVDFQRRLTRIDPPAIDLTLGSGSDDALAAYQGPAGGGRAVFLSDSNLWSDADTGAMRDITFADNQQLLENILDWVYAECFLVLGRRPSFDSVHHLIGSHAYETQINQVAAVYPVSMLEGPRFPLSAVAPEPNQIHTWGSPARIYYFTAQIVMYNPLDFPLNPEQWSQGMVVYVQDGNVVGIPFGTNNGMYMFANIVDVNGEPYVEFPFTIDNT